MACFYYLKLYNVNKEEVLVMDNFKDLRVNRKILCIDLKSFFASVECVLNGLDPFKDPLVVANKSHGEGSIVLAVTPYLKSLGVKSRLRVFELPKDIDIYFAKPQMAKYIEYSIKVINVYLEFVSKKDIYVYSIDEVFLDATNYLDYYGMSAEELAKTILNKIKESLGLYASCGIGPNMLMAKFALDIEAKKRSDNIAKWHYEDLSEKLWPVDDLSSMWGIGSKLKLKLNKLGIVTVGDLANYNKDILKRRFGVIGLELFYHANGIDSSLVKDQFNYLTRQKSYGVGQVLFRDYNYTDIQTILFEMTDELVKRLVLTNRKTKTITLSLMYSKNLGGFSRQQSLDVASNNLDIIYLEIINLLTFYYEDLPIRRVAISFSNLVDNKVKAFSIFDDVERLDKDYKLVNTFNELESRFGKGKVFKGTSLKAEATALKRAKQIGGHDA